MLRHPTPLREQVTSIGVDEHNTVTHFVITWELFANALAHRSNHAFNHWCACQLNLAVVDNGFGVGSLSFAGECRIDQRNKVFGNVQGWVIGHSVREHSASIQSFVIKRVKSYALSSAAKPCKQGAVA